MSPIRDATEADLPDLLAIFNDAVLNTTAVYTYDARTLEEEQRWFRAKREQDQPVLVALADGAVVGYATYGPFRPWPAYLYTVESSIYVAPGRRGQGIGSSLLPALIERIRAAGLHSVVAAIDTANQASLRLHEKLGFERVGHFREVGWKFDRWLDLVFLQRLL